MAEYYLGQIMMTGFGFPPKGFAQCNGQLLPVGQNQALFALFSTFYGGNGSTTFGLPDLRGRTPAGAGFSSVDPSWQPTPYTMGLSAGTETVTLQSAQLPVHIHTLGATTTPSTDSVPGDSLTFGETQGGPLFSFAPPMTTLWPDTVTHTGGGQAHPNMQPFTTINFNVALQGIFPTRG